jgi:hypothetical protein
MTVWSASSYEPAPIISLMKELTIARQSGWHARVNQDDKGSRGIRIMRLLIDAGKL